MGIAEIIQKIKKLEKAITLENKKYFLLNNPNISDHEYDSKKEFLISLYSTLREYLDELPQNSEIRKTYENLLEDMQQNSILNKVGAQIPDNIPRHIHVSQMYSLKNAFTVDDIKEFNLTTKKLLHLDNTEEIELFGEPKIDGLSFSARYSQGNFILGITRGDGRMGEDVTENMKYIKTFPQKIDNTDEEFEVRGEIYMKKSIFKNVNDSLSLNGEKLLSSVRNAAAGSLKHKDPQITKQRELSYCLWGSSTLENRGFNYVEIRNILLALGFELVPSGELLLSESSVFDYFDRIMNARSYVDYESDGVVYKVNQYKYRESLGHTSSFPRWAIAYKFPSKEYKTKLKDIELQMGKHGNITPVAVLDDISIDGAIIKKATLHNFGEIKRMDIRIGDIVFVKRAGGVIPKIERVDLSMRSDNSIVEYKNPTQCPFCGQILYISEDLSDIRCTNIPENCDEKMIQRMVNFAGKSAFEIKGLGERQIRTLFSLNVIKNECDILELAISKQKIDFISQVDGWGEVAVSNLIKSIHLSIKNITDIKILMSFCIEYVGEEVARNIIEKFGSVKSMINSFRITSYTNEIAENREVSDIMNMEIKNVGEKTISSIQKFINDEINYGKILRIIKIIDILQR